MKFRVYKDKKGESRWRLVSKNGQIIATSNEGYKRPSACIRSIERVKSLTKDVPVDKFK